MSKTIDDIYATCDVSNNGTDTPLSLDGFKAELEALLLGEDAPKTIEHKHMTRNYCDDCYKRDIVNKANATWRQHIRNKLGSKGKDSE
jgi:hypothetical protein